MQTPELILNTNLTCPECGFVEELDIPQNYCLILHACAGCGTRLKPEPGDCCVFCSYGDHPCVPKQHQVQGGER